jgi:hypothetical protein
MLHVDFFGAVAREGQIEPKMVLPFEFKKVLFIVKVGGAIPLAKEEPIAPPVLKKEPLLEKSAERGNACTGSDEDDGGIGIGRKGKAIGRLEVDGDWRRRGRLVAEEMAADATAETSGGRVRERCDGEMDLIGEHVWRRGDGVEAGHEWKEDGREFLGRRGGGKCSEDVDEVMRFEKRVELAFIFEEGAGFTRRNEFEEGGGAFREIGFLEKEVAKGEDCVRTPVEDGTVACDFEELIDNGEIVFRKDTDRIAHLKGKVGNSEGDMRCLFGRTGFCERIAFENLGREGVSPTRI